MKSASRVERQMRRANAYFQARDWPAAAAGYESVLEAQPEHAGAWIQLSYVRSWMGRYRDAHHAALSAQHLHPQDPVLQQELMARLRTFNETKHLREWVERLRTEDSNSAPVLMGLAGQLSYLNDQESALMLLDRVVAQYPDHPPALVNRGQILGFFGRTGEAEADLTRALKAAPGMLQGWWLLSRLRRWSDSENHIDSLRRIQAAVPPTGDDAALIGFALHKELDDLGDHPAAWSALEQACRAKRASVEYSTGENERLFDALLTRCDANFASNAKATTDPDAGLKPVFIVGMHRSGTTLLERILGGHPDVHNAGELYDFTVQMRQASDHHCRGVIDQVIVDRSGAVDFQAVGQGYLDGIGWRAPGKKLLTDKLPSNFLNLGFICRALPGARIIHLHRDPVSTCFSNLRELFTQACAYSYDQNELASYYHQYHRLMQHWHTLNPDRILDVSYESLVNSPESEAHRVADFCGIDFRQDMIAIEKRESAVSTASSAQVRQAIYRRPRAAWCDYESQLQPLIQGLQAAH